MRLPPLHQATVSRIPSRRHAFTLIELLLAIGVISVLSGVVIVALNPTKHFTSAQDAQSRSYAKQLENAMQQYVIDEGGMPGKGTLPAGEANAQPVCRGSLSQSECEAEGGVYLAHLTPEYLPELFTDPREGCDDFTGFSAWEADDRPHAAADYLGKEVGQTVTDACLSGWALDNASYTGVSFSVEDQESAIGAVAFNQNGTKMYITGWGSSAVHQYSLSSGYDLSTASYDGTSLDVSNEEDRPGGLAFNDDGTKMFMTGTESDHVHQYTLSSGFDVSTATHVSSFDVSNEGTTPDDVTFNDDGTRMYMADFTELYQYELSTAYDITTASYDASYSDISAWEDTPLAIAFNDDGTRMYVTGPQSEQVLEFSLPTAFDISTASHTGLKFDVSSEVTPQGLTFSRDGTRMFLAGSGDRIVQYTTEELDN